MINQPIQNPTPKVIESINSMCNYLDTSHKCSGACEDCPLVKVLNYLHKYI